MAFPGYGAALAFILSWIDKLIPSKKAALVKRLRELNVLYLEALEDKRDTDAAVIRKQMDELRKKANFSEGEI